MASNDLPPMQAPRPNAGQSIQWDKPVGYSHAASILAAVTR